MNRAKGLFFTISLLALNPNAWSQTCATKPSCTELGYLQTEDDCAGKNMVRCPFDSTAVFCGGSTCSYKNTSLPANCASAASCEINSTTYYDDVCTACNSGYELQNGACSCTYTATTSPSNCSSVDSCEKDGTTYYTCLACSGRYMVENGQCIFCKCKGSSPDLSCSSNNVISSGKDTCGNTCYYCRISGIRILDVITSTECTLNNSNQLWQCNCHYQAHPDANSTCSGALGNFFYPYGGDTAFYDSQEACESVCESGCNSALGTQKECSNDWLLY